MPCLLSCLFFFNVVRPSEDPVQTWVLCPIFVAFLLVLVTIFMRIIFKTMEGYSALILRRVDDDGTLPEEKMMNAVKGKLTEVVCEAAPQSVAQVLFCLNVSSSHTHSFTQGVHCVQGWDSIKSPSFWHSHLHPLSYKGISISAFLFSINIIKR